MLARFATARAVRSASEPRSSVASAASRIAWRVKSVCRWASVAIDMENDVMSDCMTSTVRIASERSKSMSKRTVVVKRGDAEQLRVMGAAVRFLCGADKTDRAWSVMEVELPRSEEHTSELQSR